MNKIDINNGNVCLYDKNTKQTNLLVINLKVITHIFIYI